MARTAAAAMIMHDGLILVGISSRASSCTWLPSMIDADHVAVGHVLDDP